VSFEHVHLCTIVIQFCIVFQNYMHNQLLKVIYTISLEIRKQQWSVLHRLLWQFILYHNITSRHLHD